MPALATTKLRCVDDRLAGRILTPGEQDWDELRGAFNLLVDQRPAAIALAADVHDVTMVVRLAAEHGLRVAPQATGHNAGPLGDLEDTVLVKTSALAGTSVDRDERRARVGAGARWQDVVPRASELGLAALHGFSAGVGVVGYSLGGGIGWYARRHGLQSNSVRAVEIVAPDGRRLLASAESEPAIEFDLYEVPEVYAGALFFPFERSAEVLHAWNEWQATAPEEVTSDARLMQFPALEGVPEPVRGKSFAIVEAAFLGGEPEGADLIAPLRGLGAAMDTFAMAPPEALGMLHMDPSEPVPAVSAHLLLGDLPEGAIDDLVSAAGPGSGSRLTSVELRQLGGALGRSDPGCGALASLPGSLALLAVGSPLSPADAEVMRAQAARVSGLLAPHAAGRLLNFVEQPCDTASGFEADAYRRLREVRAAYDPGCVMHANHPVPPG